MSARSSAGDREGATWALAEPLSYLLWALLIGGVLSILVFLGRDLPAPPKLSRTKVLGALDREVDWRPDPTEIEFFRALTHKGHDSPRNPPCLGRIMSYLGCRADFGAWMSERRSPSIGSEPV